MWVNLFSEATYVGEIPQAVGLRDGRKRGTLFRAPTILKAAETRFGVPTVAYETRR